MDEEERLFRHGVFEYPRPGHSKELSPVPLPRYPWFVHVSPANWFKTTVNPLVWELIESRYWPTSANDTGRFGGADDQGLVIDTWFWGLEVDDLGTKLEDLVRHRPDSLLDLRITRKIFALLTSGFTADRQRGMKALENLAQRKGGDEPEHEIETLQDTTHKIVRSIWDGENPKTSGREKLLEALRRQELAWIARSDNPDATKEDVVRMVRGRTSQGSIEQPSASSLRGDLKALERYVELLCSSDMLQRSAHKLYENCEGAQGLATQTLRDAIEWLQEDGRQSAS